MVRLQLSALNLLCVEVSLKPTCLVPQTRLEMSQVLFRNHTLLSLQAHIEMFIYRCELLVTMSLIPGIPLRSLKSVVTHLPGVLSALQRCLLEAPGSVHDTLDRSLTDEVLGLLEKISLLLLGVLYGDLDACATEKGKRSNLQREC